MDDLASDVQNLSLEDNLDLDDSPICHCMKRPNLIERAPIFKNFVDSVLQASTNRQHLTRFRLRFGGDKTRYYYLPSHYRCVETCSPELETERLNAWMCFSLTRNVRELDLSIHVRNRGKVPPEVFSCETLEVLKLDLTLDIDDAQIVSIKLPRLKLLHLCSVLIPCEDFVTRLVSSCPSLEDLAIEHYSWEKEDFITISSPSLQRLVLNMADGRTSSKTHELEPSQVVLIDTPNLESLKYLDNLAWIYYFRNMNALVKAEIINFYILQNGTPWVDFLAASFQSMLGLVQTLSNVHHLSLRDSCMEALTPGDIRGQLPMFRNLKHLELGYTFHTGWGRILLEFLDCSPFLETLVFPEGLSDPDFLSYHNDPDEDKEAFELELECWRTTRAICCASHLKRIAIRQYMGSERELELLKFLLRNASVLEELVACRMTCPPTRIDQMSLEIILKNLPRSSINCSIRVE